MQRACTRCGGSASLARAYNILYIAPAAEKPIFWVGSVLRDLRRFPAAARREAGHQLHRVQLGLMPSDWKAMPAIGTGVLEIRIRAAREHRVCYVARFKEGIYVLHAFEKKTQRTRNADLRLTRDRLKQMLSERRLRVGGDGSS